MCLKDEGPHLGAIFQLRGLILYASTLFRGSDKRGSAGLSGEHGQQRREKRREEGKKRNKSSYLFDCYLVDTLHCSCSSRRFSCFFPAQVASREAIRLAVSHENAGCPLESAIRARPSSPHCSFRPMSNRPSGRRESPAGGDTARILNHGPLPFDGGERGVGGNASPGSRQHCTARRMRAKELAALGTCAMDQLPTKGEGVFGKDGASPRRRRSSAGIRWTSRRVRPVRVQWAALAHGFCPLVVVVVVVVVGRCRVRDRACL